MNGYSDGGWWAFAMMFLSIVFLACIVGGIVLVARRSHGEKPARRPEGNRALDILDERYARGEVDQSEYEERRRTLTRDG